MLLMRLPRSLDRLCVSETEELMICSTSLTLGERPSSMVDKSNPAAKPCLVFPEGTACEKSRQAVGDRTGVSIASSLWDNRGGVP
mmetsp:Transcript_16418/g.39541  ORF Transcript_16418/g.39541 Transcript_16418/m.39541 type:complete len:85 (-) Transcript_16418:131-385(-)